MCDLLDPIPITGNSRWMGDQEVLRRLQAALENNEKLYAACGAETDEEGWSVRIRHSLERIMREIERRFESAQSWSEDYPKSLAQTSKIDGDELKIDLPDVNDMAHSACQEALSFGMSHDVFKRHMQSAADRTESAIRQALKDKGLFKDEKARVSGQPVSCCALTSS